MNRRHLFVVASLSLLCVAPLLARAQSAPAPAPTAAPTTAPLYEHFAEFDYIPALVAYDQWSNGNVGTNTSFGSNSNRIRIGLEFSIAHIPFMALGEFDQLSYPHNAGNVEVIGGNGFTYIPALTVTEYELVARLGVGFAPHHWYAAYSYMYHSDIVGDPDLLGSGPGVEKLPDLGQRLSFSGSIYYYPELHNPHPFPSLSHNIPLSYRTLTYDLGANWVISSHLFASFGIVGDHWFNRTNAPADATHFGPRIGIGANI